MYSKQVAGCFLVYSSLINILLLIFCYEKCLFKASGRLLLVYSINQYCTPNVLLRKICFQSKPEAGFSLFIINVLLQKTRVRSQFWVYSSLIKCLMFYCEKCVRMEGYFLVYSLSISILCLMFYHEKFVFEASGRLLLVYSSIISIVCQKCFCYKLPWKNAF